MNTVIEIDSFLYHSEWGQFQIVIYEVSIRNVKGAHAAGGLYGVHSILYVLHNEYLQII